MNIRRNSAVLFSIIASTFLFALFLLPGAASAQTQAVHHKIEYRYKFSSPKQISSSSGQMSSFSGQMSSLFGKSSNTSQTTSNPNYHSGSDNCIRVGISATNPVPGDVKISWIIWNGCSVTLSAIHWYYSSTVICNSQAYNGPSNSGTVGLAPTYYKSAVESVSSECIIYENGVPIGTEPYDISFTMSANQVILQGNTLMNYYGNGNSPTYTFD